MLRKVIISCLLLAVLSPLMLLTLLIDPSPSRITPYTPGVEDARRAKMLVKRTLYRLEHQKRSQLNASVTDLNAVVAFLSRGARQLTGRVQMQNQQLEISLSFRIPKTLFGEYINFYLRVTPADQGIDIDKLSIGSLKVPSGLALSAAHLGIDLLAGESFSRQIAGTIENVAFSRDQVQVTFRPGAKFEPLKHGFLNRLRDVQSDYGQGIDAEKLNVYLARLNSFGPFEPQRPTSLTRIIAPLFELAQQRSQDSSPVEENRAALFALSVALGGQKFRKLASHIAGQQDNLPRPPQGRFVLAGRRDLRLHFLVSAGVKLLSDSTMGFVAGEYKELLDANRGGSGFSFIDLAADRAGLAFAESATASTQSARLFQQIMATAEDESSYFPNFSDLEEGLDQHSFVTRYDSIDGDPYEKVIRQIDQRLTSLPLHRSTQL